LPVPLPARLPPALKKPRGQKSLAGLHCQKYFPLSLRKPEAIKTSPEETPGKFFYAKVSI